MAAFPLVLCCLLGMNQVTNIKVGTQFPMKQFENTNHHHRFYHTTHQREASKNADKKFIDDKIELTRSG